MPDDTLKTLGLSADALTPATDANGETFAPLAPVMEEATEEAVPRVQTQRRRPNDYARSFIQQKFALHANRAQVVFERVYGRTDASLTYLTVSIADRGMLKLAERLEDELDKRFTKIEQEIEAACNHCEKLFDERQVPVANRHAQSDKPRIYDVPLRTNFSARFLQLFSRFDELLCRVEALWINGIFRATGRSQMIEKWDRQVRNFAGGIRSLRDRTHQEIRNLQNEAQAAAKAQSAEGQQAVEDIKPEIDHEEEEPIKDLTYQESTPDAANLMANGEKIELDPA